MEFAIIIVVILGLGAVEIFGLYFIFSQFVRPQKVGLLIRFLWSLFIASAGLYLIFLSPVSIQGYFAPGYNWGFISVIGVAIILFVLIWLTMAVRKNNN